MPAAKPRLQKLILGTAYELVSVLDRRGLMTFMNFGYASTESEDGRTEPVLSEPDVYCAQMYRQVVEPGDLRGKDVLEVSCGRGGGAAFIMRYYQPRSMVGLDLAGRAVAFCRRHHRYPGLFFQKGDAEALPFPPASFAAIVTVESSHTSPTVTRFFAEAQRGLRPGGYLLFVDIRLPEQVQELRDQLRGAGFEIEQEQRVTPNVVRALDLDSERRLSATRTLVPKSLQRIFAEFAGVKGTETYDRFSSGRLEYIRFALRKPA